MCCHCMYYCSILVLIVCVYMYERNSPEQVLEGACIGNWCSLVGNLDMLFLFTQWQHRTGGGQACPLKISEIILLNSNVFLFGYW